MSRPMNLDEQLAHWKERAEKAEKAVADQKSAVERFLGARGHDLCWVNRAELAMAFGIIPKTERDADMAPSEHEFRKGCDAYARRIYRNEEVSNDQGIDWKQDCYDTIRACLEALVGAGQPLNVVQAERATKAYGEEKLSQTCARVAKERRDLLDAAQRAARVLKARSPERYAMNVVLQQLTAAINQCADAEEAVWRGELPNDDGEEAFYFLVTVICEPKSADFQRVYEWVRNQAHETWPTAKLGVPGTPGSFYLNHCVVKPLPRFQWIRATE
jgi:hypothetical protein